MHASIDGQVIGEAGWTFSVGTSPHVATIEVEGSAAQRIFDGAKTHGSILRLRGDEQGEVLVERLTVLGLNPTSSPHTVGVQLADRRWTWPRRQVHRSYNMRRRSGRVRRGGDQAGVTPAGAPRQTQNLVQDVDYHPWSLRLGAKPWTAREVLTDVMNRVAGADNWEERADSLNPGELPEIEELEIAGFGDAAVAQVLAALGGAIGIFVNRQGKAIVFNRLDDGERELIGAPGRTSVGSTVTRAGNASSHPLVVGDPVWSVADRRMERPSKVRVLYDLAVELRVDFTEPNENLIKATSRPGLKLGAGAELELAASKAEVENVIRLPEDIPAGAIGNAEDLVKSTFVTVDDYLAFLKLQAREIKLPAINRKVLNNGWLSSALEVYTSPNLDPSGLWARRIAPFREGYRRVFRLKRPWVDRIRGMSATRVAIEDQERHSRVKSPVFQDYAEWTTWRHASPSGLTANDGPGAFEIVQNRFAFIADPEKPLEEKAGPIVGTPIERLKQAPALVTILDEDQGLFVVDLVFDFEGEAVRYVRSALKKINKPTDDMTKQALFLQNGGLRADFQLSTILTIKPGAPNDNRRLYAVEVDHATGAGGLPGGAGSEQALGPVWEVKVSRIPARFGWDDSVAPAFFQAFAIGTDPQGTDPDQVEAGQGGVGERDGNLGNALGVPINADRLALFAQAVAEQVYAKFRDHVIGGLTTGLLPGAEPAGTATSVRQSVTMGPNGGALTTVDLPADPPIRDVTSRLPADLRRLVDRFVDL